MHMHAVMGYNRIVKHVFVLFVLVEVCLISTNHTLFRYSIIDVLYKEFHIVCR